MTLVTIIYVVLLLVFGVFAAFIFRHVSRYGCLSPGFKMVVSIFGLMALAVIVFSLYLLIVLYKGTVGSIPDFRPTPASSGQSELNF